MVQRLLEAVGPPAGIRRAQDALMQGHPEVGQVHRELWVARIGGAHGGAEGVDGGAYVGVRAVTAPGGAGGERHAQVGMEHGHGLRSRPRCLGGAGDGLVQDGVRARLPGLDQRVQGAREVAVVHPPVRVTRGCGGHRAPPGVHRLVQLRLVPAHHRIAVP
ncbi:hypothetical protein PV416_09925 [Streptomyces ipomoeae]|uniref:hypothetical protein n=1 Tax=Streptomyces ipomoeae TaxID=103232 RepID=UPI0029B36244|nr:hypothetical protein [Streptomyces ipomoeae]MDX2821398.1 hypothetical protein [Streptomyces ipomoeae]MDX2839619.1 hypothetical protein [Streptomyces ipomoeae]